MNPFDRDNQSTQPLRELEWLVEYFMKHNRKDLARQLREEIRQTRHRAQISLSSVNADVAAMPDHQPASGNQMTA